MGIGGSPGASVYVKIGASVDEPAAGSDGQVWLRMNTDKGNQANEGAEMLNAGNLEHPQVLDAEYRIKSLDNAGRPIQVTADEDGNVWLITGVDSGFEGLTKIYVTGLHYLLTATN